MKTNNNVKTFDISDVDWNELAQIGIIKNELELDGQLDRLFGGEKTEVYRFASASWG